MPSRQAPAGGAPPLPSHARAVIIGGGIVGCSVAYHLARLGWTDVLLLERRRLTCGTTWHAAGLVRGMLYSPNLTRLARYTLDLYGRLEAETGQATGLKQNGSVSIATNAERWEELRRLASSATAFGVEAHGIGAAEAKALWPMLETGDVLGAVFFPHDGQTNPTDTTMALAAGARQAGVRIVEDVAVTGIVVRGRRAVGVETAAGTVAAEVVVNCAGMWAREVGALAGVAVPLHACEHFYAVTEPMGLPPTLPVLRDMDGCAYYKEDAGKLLFGAFEPTAKPWGMAGIPADFCFDELPPDLDHFAPILEGAMHRVPDLRGAGIRTFFNGPESFTPDQRYYLGPAPDLDGFYVAAGFNSIGIQSAGGAGKALAEWIVEGAPPFDLWEVDLRRAQPFQADPSYLVPRVSEALGLLYAMHWPHRQYETARNIRLSPLHERLDAAGACFAETAGWERPAWFAPAGMAPVYRYSYGRQNWFPHAAAEHRAVREAVGLFDQTPFSKFRVEGPAAEAALQRLCANDVAVPPGRIVYTQWLNPRGGIEADLTVTRLGDTAFLVVGGAATAVRDAAWLRRHLPPGAVAVDVTAAEAVLGVMGPRSRALLQPLTDADLSNAAFPFGTAQTLMLAGVPVRAHRITYVGELGWELYVAPEFARRLLDRLREAGRTHRLALAGLHAMDSLRIEKAYRHWGHDISDEDTPLEAGLAFACRLDKPVPFIGQESLRAQRDRGMARRLLQFALLDPEPLLYHYEPVFRAGQHVGHIASAAYGHTLGAAVGLGYVPVEPGRPLAALAGEDYEIEIAGRRVPARASLRPLYDPTGARVRS